MGCALCEEKLLGSREEAGEVADFTRQCDYGGLLYSSGELFKFITILEDTFTECFSSSALHHDSVVDLIELLKGRRVAQIGCDKHHQLLTSSVMSFYLLARLHFYVKTLNRSGTTRRKAAHARRLTRCS